MPTRSVDLTDRDNSFIEASIAEGRFSNTSEAIHAGLFLLEREAAEERSKLDWLRATTQEAFAALDRGEGVQIDSANGIDTYMDGILRSREARQITTRD